MAPNLKEPRGPGCTHYFFEVCPPCQQLRQKVASSATPPAPPVEAPTPTQSTATDTPTASLVEQVFKAAEAIPELQMLLPIHPNSVMGRALREEGYEWPATSSKT